VQSSSAVAAVAPAWCGTCHAGPAWEVSGRRGITPDGVLGHRAGYEMSMTPGDDLKEELGQSVTLVGALVAVILIGLLIGLAI
jgi:hypothetical protein